QEVTPAPAAIPAAHPDRLSGRALLAIFGVALTLRLGHVLAMRRSPYFTHPVVDAETYRQAALALVTGQGFPDPVFWQPPGYPYFLALVYAVFGPGFLAPRLVQAVLGAASAVLVACLGARCFGPRVGLCAGIGAA